MTFSELGLNETILKAINDAGYTSPTPIQEQAIPLILQGKDVLGIAQTGTGKTASFTLPMIEILQKGRARARMPRSLVVSPTRELAAQIYDNFKIYGKYTKLSTVLLVGGESMGEQTRVLSGDVDVLICTPGRLLDLFERGHILLNDIKIFVIDEADRMLDMGFIPDLEKIHKILPPIRQTLMVSATMPDPIRKLSEKFLTFPKSINVSPPSRTADNVEQSFIYAKKSSDKTDKLVRYVKEESIKNALIFCNRKRDIGAIKKRLDKDSNYTIGMLHGDMAQSERTRTLNSFKKNDIAILVCSDVAARGLDIAELSHVINYDVPTNPEDYVHRIGRTGRAGKSGQALTLACPDDQKFLDAIAQKAKIDLPEKDQQKTPDKSEKKQQQKTRSPESDNKNQKTASRGQKKNDQPKKTTPNGNNSDRNNKQATGFGDEMPAFFQN